METLREYGRERLAEEEDEDQVHARHLHYYVGLVEQAAAESDRAQQAVHLERLEAERENLWAALRWARDHEARPGDERLAGALGRLAERLAEPLVRRSLTPLAFELRRLQVAGLRGDSSAVCSRSASDRRSWRAPISIRSSATGRPSGRSWSDSWR